MICPKLKKSSVEKNLLIENCNIFCFLGLHEEFKATEEAVDPPPPKNTKIKIFI